MTLSEWTAKWVTQRGIIRARPVNAASLVMNIAVQVSPALCLGALVAVGGIDARTLSDVSVKVTQIPGIASDGTRQMFLIELVR